MQVALRSRLKGDAGVSALVGPRVYWGDRPQGSALPAIVLNLISDGRGYLMQGADATQQYRVQIDIYGSTYAAMDAVRGAVVTCLELTSGSFQPSFVMRNSDLEESTDTALLYRASMDFKITYSA